MPLCLSLSLSLSIPQILAAKNTDPSKPLVTVESIVREHWAKYGRNYYAR